MLFSDLAEIRPGVTQRAVRSRSRSLTEPVMHTDATVMSHSHFRYSAIARNGEN